MTKSGQKHKNAYNEVEETIIKISLFSLREKWMPLVFLVHLLKELILEVDVYRFKSQKVLNPKIGPLIESIFKEHPKAATSFLKENYHFILISSKLGLQGAPLNDLGQFSR